MKLRYEEFDLAGIKTYPLRSRQSKVSLAQFATPYKAGSGLDGFLKSLPSLLAAGISRTSSRRSSPRSARAARSSGDSARTC